MKYLNLVLKSARRSKRRTALTILSVAIAVFLFASLRAVLEAFHATAAASSSTRVVTIRSTSLIFSMPISHADAIRSIPGVQDLTWAYWFGGIYKDAAHSFSNFAIDPESYLRMYPEVLLTPEERRAFLADRTGCVVGDGLARSAGFKVGDRITLKVGIPTYGTRDYDFTVRGVYRTSSRAFDNQSMLFHWKYVDERSIVKAQAGWFVSRIASPDEEPRISAAIDAKFANSPFETKTDTEKEFAASFVSMFGNLNLLLGSIAVAVVVATLFVAGNTMAMSVRERTTEIAVMRTLGFPGATIFGLVAAEALLMSIVGGAIGVVLARALVNPNVLPSGGFIPELSVGTAETIGAMALSAFIGVAAGVIPATLASRLKIVDALRRVG